MRLNRPPSQGPAEEGRPSVRNAAARAVPATGAGGGDADRRCRRAGDTEVDTWARRPGRCRRPSSPRDAQTQPRMGHAGLRRAGGGRGGLSVGRPRASCAASRGGAPTMSLSLRCHNCHSEAARGSGRLPEPRDRSGRDRGTGSPGATGPAQTCSSGGPSPGQAERGFSEELRPRRPVIYIKCAPGADGSLEGFQKLKNRIYRWPPRSDAHADSSRTRAHEGGSASDARRAGQGTRLCPFPWGRKQCHGDGL